MVSKKEIYKCEVCGNIVEVLDAGGGILTCCAQPMKKLEEQTEEQGNEKHKPVIEVGEDSIIVKVGDVPHPMEESHWIEWIELTTPYGIMKKFLKPGMKPKAEFPITGEEKDLSARAYCNLHGLWKS